MNDKKQKVQRWLPALFSPLAVMCMILFNFKKYGLYPFGDATSAWGDMIQQVIPLLVDFKDILAGKTGMFLNFPNAGGMNMWGVFFFFLASPFTFLVAFVEKTDILHFANILIMLKLMTCSLTASIYLRKRVPKLSGLWVVLLSVTYALSGYGMLYYQNIIWLDMMYLFPLLLLSLETMLEKKRVIPYTAALSAMMIVNYYIGYMVVVFLMLFIGMAVLYLGREEKYRQAPLHFIAGSAMGALATAVVWLPSLLQYLTSGRKKEEFWKPIIDAHFFTNYETILPTVLHSVLLIAVVLVFVADGRTRTKKQNAYLILAGLLSIPLVIEPINMMWHTGNYMSFPSRYGFMTLFMLAVCAAMFISDDENRPFEGKKFCDHPAVLVVLVLLIWGFDRFVIGFVDSNIDTITKYVLSLWGNDDSYHLILEIFILAFPVYMLVLILHKKGILSKQVLAVLCAMLTGVECWLNCTIYLSRPGAERPDYAAEQETIYDLSDRIDDNSGFYRVKTDGKIFYVNLVGPLGYNSISHYTSLNSQDYMFMMKKLGYSSNWMDVGSYGGTEFTDALMSIKYIIEPYGGDGERTVYSNDRYRIDPLDYYMPLGLVIDDSNRPDGELPALSRGELQEYIYEHTLGDGGELITMYDCDDLDMIYSDGEGKQCFIDGENYHFTLDIKGRQTLYIDAFDEPAVGLGSPVDNSFEIYVDDELLNGSYPNGDFNGVFCAGTFEDEVVEVRLKALKDVGLRSFGVFTLDTGKLMNDIQNAHTASFTQDGGKLTGKCDSNGSESMILSIPYSDNLRIKVNGKSAEVRRAFDDMTMIKLENGTNEIIVTAIPKGFMAGLVLTLIGIALCILYHFKLGKLLSKFHSADKAVTAALLAASAAVFAVIYILPLYKHLKGDK